MNTRLLLRSRALPLVALLLSLSFGTRAQDAPADEPSPTPEASEGERRSSGSRDDVDSRDGSSSRRRRGSGSRDDVGGERRGGDRTDVATAPDEEIPAPEEGVGSAVQAQLPTGESPTSMSPQAIQLPTGEGSIQGMGESFAPVLSSGTATFSVPIAVPAGRAGVQPSLGISYSSSGGNGVVGIGWNIGVPFIARQTDRGTPRFDDRASWHRGEDRFIYNGGQELVPVSSSTIAMVDAAGHYGAAPPSVPAELSGWQQYRAKVEGGFMRFFRSPDSTRWVVQSLDGTRFEFGLLPSTVGRPVGFDPRYGVLSENADGTGRIHTWLLTRMSDAHGSTVYYQYFADQGARYLADIYYLSPASACAPSGASIAAIRDCTAPLSDYGVRIRFAYETRPDAFTSYTSGWAVRQGLRLRTITATSAEENVGTRYLVRRYWLTYDTQRFHSVLTQVQVEGRTEAANGFVGQPVFSRTVEGAPPAAPVGRTLPAMRFEYTTMPSAGPQAPGFGGIDATVHMVASSPPVSLDAPLVDLFDVNGDGLQDVLVTDGARYRTPDGRPGVGVYWNGFLGALAQPAAGATFSTPQVLPLEAGATTILSYSNPNLLGMDVDGDGRGDFLHLPPTLGHGWITPARLHPTPAASPRQQDWAFVHTPRPVDASTDPSINLARDGTFFRVMDVNNDHLVDIVRTTGTEMQTWLNLGWVPGGEGRFGQATPTESGWQLSSQPIRTCLLHDGQPLDFGNGEVRLGDMNGDGLTDIVRMRNNRITYWPGRGGALWGEGSRTCTSGFGASRHIEMSAPPQPLNAELAGVYLQDVDGDGADDVVQVRYRQLDVWFNRAGREFTARITVDSPYAPDFAPNLRFVDIDGSGTTDLLYGRAGQWQYLDLLGGERPRLLAKVHNGLGATTSLEYGSSTEDYLRDLAAASQCTGASCERFTWDGVRDNGCDGVVDRYAGECVYRSGGSPVISRVVRRVQTTDNFAALGVASQVSTQEFAYHDGYYEGIEQEFRGFGAADAHVLGDATVGGLWTRTYFHQGRRPNDIATDRLQENPEEALKGSTYLSEVFDEGGRYLSSAHSSYTVRRLATGLDDRPISFAFGHQTDSFTYDTTSYSAYGAAVDLPAQRWETHGETAPPRTETRPVRIRATRFVWTRSTSDAVDNLGQVHQSTAHGRLHDEDDAPSTDPIAYAEGIVSFRTFGFVAAHESGWMLRPIRSYVQDAAGGPLLGETTVIYGARGDALRSVQVVQAATPLEFGGDADAPGYTYGTQTLEASTSFDLFGNATASCAGADLASDADGLSCLRYARVTYDAAYFQLPVVEQIATGVTTQGGETSLVTLPTEATYERGLGLLLTATDPNGAVTSAYYDGLGRTLAVDTPNGVCATTGAPEQTITYTLLPGGKPVSFVETTTDARAAPDCATALVTRARAYVDGLGRARAGLTFAADEAPNRVIVSGLSVLDARGQARVAYDPEARTIAGEPAVEAVLVPGAGVPFVQAVYDPFGRATEAVAQDGSVARTEHHASSVYGFDPNDDPTQNRHAPQHWNTPSISRVDGHGRAIEQVQLLRQPGETSGSVRYLHLRSEYRADGKVLRVIRAETSSPARWQSTSVVGGHQVERTFTYDTAGRRVTTTDPDSDSRTRTEASRHWRYLFNRVGDLVAVRDPRGCGQDFFYDRAGRLVAEDYIACGEAQQGGETSVGTVSGVIGLELGASRAVDVLNTYDAMPAWVPTLSPAPPTTHLKGRPTGSIDRAQRTAVAYDVRGNAVWTARQLALIPADPSIPSTLSGDAPAVVVADAAPPVAPSYDTVRTYVMTDSFDAAGRPYRRDYPRDPDWTLFRPVGDTTPSPVISGRITYNQRGLPTATGIYFGNTLQRTVLASASYDAYGAPTTMRLRSATVDQALTQTFEYDVRHRPHAVRTERGLSSGIGGADGTLNAIRVPFHELYDWDRASNLVGITSLASAPGAFPAGRRQQRRSVDHDSLNRVAHVFTEYLQDDLTWAPNDVGSDYRAERSRTNQDGTTHRVADPMQSTPAPSVVPQPSSRVVDLMYEYDWLANMTSWEDDARAFHERSIGAIGNGADASAAADLRPSALYLSSNVRTSGFDPLEPSQGWLDVDYGEGGNVVAVTVRAQCTDRAPSQCVDTPTDDPAAREAQLLAGCLCASEQHYQYRWDELNRLAEARRYDRTGGTGTWSLAARLRYRYDAANTRLVKQSLDPQQTGTLRERTHLFVFPGNFERVGLRTNRTASPPRYVASTALGSETEYHVAGAHLVWKASANPGNFGRNRRLTMPIGDLLGTASAVVDLDSGHLVELATFHPNGAREMHWMTDEASLARERNAFTGKEEDEEVGVAYFGHRYLMPRLGRWASPDPLSVHAMGGGEAGNAFHYVGGSLLESRDPIGLSPLDSDPEYQGGVRDGQLPRMGGATPLPPLIYPPGRWSWIALNGPPPGYLEGLSTDEQRRWATELRWGASVSERGDVVYRFYLEVEHRWVDPYRDAYAMTDTVIDIGMAGAGLFARLARGTLVSLGLRVSLRGALTAPAFMLLGVGGAAMGPVWIPARSAARVSGAQTLAVLRRMAELLNEVRRDVASDLMTYASRHLSEAELARGIHPGNIGQTIERELAHRVEEAPDLQGVVSYHGRSNSPFDFRIRTGDSPAGGVGVDVTSDTGTAVSSHLDRGQVDAVLSYEHFSPRTATSSAPQIAPDPTPE